MGILSSSRGLRRVILPRKSPEEVVSFLNELGEAKASCYFIDGSLGDLPRRLKSYLAGEPMDFPDSLDLAGTTDFQRSVWQIVRTIPYAKTKNYAWVASQLGLGKSARSVGQALARNPLPIVVPCHRVIGSDGSLGGFSGGAEMKRYLLSLEAGGIGRL